MTLSLILVEAEEDNPNTPPPYPCGYLEQPALLVILPRLLIAQRQNDPLGNQRHTPTVSVSTPR